MQRIYRQSRRRILKNRQRCRNSCNPVFPLRNSCRLSHLVYNRHIHWVSDHRTCSAVPDNPFFKKELYSGFKARFYGNNFVQKNRNRVLRLNLLIKIFFPFSVYPTFFAIWSLKSCKVTNIRF